MTPRRCGRREFASGDWFDEDCSAHKAVLFASVIPRGSGKDIGSVTEERCSKFGGFAMCPTRVHRAARKKGDNAFGPPEGRP
jgi:hypothetical protein